MESIKLGNHIKVPYTDQTIPKAEVVTISWFRVKTENICTETFDFFFSKRNPWLHWLTWQKDESSEDKINLVIHHFGMLCSNKTGQYYMPVRYIVMRPHVATETIIAGERYASNSQ